MPLQDPRLPAARHVGPAQAVAPPPLGELVGVDDEQVVAVRHHGVAGIWNLIGQRCSCMLGIVDFFNWLTGKDGLALITTLLRPNSHEEDNT